MLPLLGLAVATIFFSMDSESEVEVEGDLIDSKDERAVDGDADARRESSGGKTHQLRNSKQFQLWKTHNLKYQYLTLIEQLNGAGATPSFRVVCETCKVCH